MGGDDAGVGEGSPITPPDGRVGVGVGVGGGGGGGGGGRGESGGGGGGGMTDARKTDSWWSWKSMEPSLR